MSAILSPFGWLYGKIANARNTLYDRAYLRSFSLGARTISIGNISTGGTGKTPLVAFVAEILAEQGEKVCVLTRGYGRENPQARVLVSDGEQLVAGPAKGGDEPVELAGKLLGKAVVVADADRVAAARWAKDRFGVTAFVLDDAFQHRRAKRDVDIVCIDATNPFGNGKILPAGRLREPLANLRRANAVVITRANLANAVPDPKFEISDLKLQISAVAPGLPIFTCENRVTGLTEIGEFHAKAQRAHREAVSIGFENKLWAGDLYRLQDTGSFAFCALGNPSGFFMQLKVEALAVVGERAFRDHYVYRQSDVDEIEKLATAAGAKRLLTTAKDAVKLKGFHFNFPCFVVETEPRMDDPDLFRTIL